MTTVQVLTLDLMVNPVLELPLVSVIATMLSSVWKQRKDGIVNRSKTRAELEARCRLLREGRGNSLEKAHILTSNEITTMFSTAQQQQQ